MGIASRFSAIGQLKFPAVQIPSTDVNTLDDYEEGTWTPVYEGATGSIGATAYTSRAGRYTKIGRFVFITGSVILSNNGDWTSYVKITGLPFAPALTVCGAAYLSNITFDGYVTSYIGAGTQNVLFLVTKTNAAGDYVYTTNTPDTGSFTFTIAYSV
jgi:hypothetical protein